MYFLTVCVKDRKQLLGKIVGCGDFDAPQMILSEYGQILDKYMIMPNHFHLILKIKDYKNGASETAAPYNNETSKFVSLLKRYCNIVYGKNIWQFSYNDHMIRGEKECQKILEYIETNSLKLESDCFYNDKRS